MNWKIREVAAGEFKAKCLQLMDEVNEDGVELVITKRGKPVAKLVPIADDKPVNDGWGCMKGRGKVLDENWSKAEPDDYVGDDDQF